MKLRIKNIVEFFVITSFLVILASTLVQTTNDGKEYFQFKSDTIGIHSNDNIIELDTTYNLPTMGEEPITLFKPPNPIGDEPTPTVTSRPPNPIGDEPIPTVYN